MWPKDANLRVISLKMLAFRVSVKTMLEIIGSRKRKVRYFQVQLDKLKNL